VVGPLIRVEGFDDDDGFTDRVGGDDQVDRRETVGLFEGFGE